jgi:hypothetical protein
MNGNKDKLVRTVGQQGEKGFVMHRDGMSLNASSQIRQPFAGLSIALLLRTDVGSRSLFLILRFRLGLFL